MSAKKPIALSDSNERLVFSSGRVSAEKIEEKILFCQELELAVFFVGITAGTTVLGAFDPIEEIAFVCRKYQIWLHVDVSALFLRNQCTFSSRFV